MYLEMIRSALEEVMTPKMLLGIAKIADCEDGSFEWTRTFYLEELDEVLQGFPPSEIVKKVFFGNVHSITEGFRLNAYENLESASDYELMWEAQSAAYDIIDWLMDNEKYWCEYPEMEEAVTKTTQIYMEICEEMYDNR